MFKLFFTKSARDELDRLEKEPGKKGLVKQIKKTLGLLQTNPRHPSLQTHPYSSIENPFDSDQKVFEAYAGQHTSSAYRVFWCYGPEKHEMTIIAITPHP